ncbi:cytochrome p450 [Moniliophthora roreri MCA 2997]|uniref:Cytochrome p450 n=1 Tax=Moniliophthora roreri (strain MCA 2997) TaxID=1381753 RepID=V2XY77_MONRO|nr:cytochrome p450 [Moniliophthora roreri MCA 2997]
MSSVLIALSALFAAFIAWKVSRKRISTPLPPGPKPLPIIGNALDMPKDYPWRTFAEWCKQYGNLVHVNVLGQPIVIVGSGRVAYDLFEKKSSVFSGRAHSTMVIDLMGWGWSFGMMNYGEDWKNHRRVFHQFFNQNVVERYQLIQLKEAHALLRRLYETPEDFLGHIRVMFAATIMDIAYGIPVEKRSDEYIEIAETALEGLSAAAVPGAYLVDQLPFLKYVPSWFPGASFQRKAAYWKYLSETMVHKSYNAVKDAFNKGDAKPSMVTSLSENMPTDDTRAEAERVARNAAGVAYSGGADTTVAAVQTFFLAMVCYPEIQKKAQAELAAVVGTDTLPTFENRSRLPYINAMIKETMRWQPVTPLAVPHYTTSDEIYDGYHIPAGSIVMGNVWAMLHDPVVYPEPSVFKPERFLKEDGTLNPEAKDPGAYAFGFGRRICPGRFLSDASLYTVITSVLSVCDILPPLDERGEPIKIEPAWTTGLVQYPLPFKCRIKPRSKAAEHLIQHSDL